MQKLKNVIEYSHLISGYVAFMKVNLQAEAGFKRLIGANKVSDPGLVANNVSVCIKCIQL